MKKIQTKKKPTAKTGAKPAAKRVTKKAVTKPRVNKAVTKTVKAAKPEKAIKPEKAVKVQKAAEEPSISQLLARELAVLTLEKKATDVKILDLRELTTITDFFVICTAHSDTQVKAVADAVIDGAKKIGERAWHKEGLSQKSWVLLDYVDVVVHVFLKDTREFYGLEKLWGDAPCESISD